MERLIGIDIGYGFVKATDSRVGYVFPSVVGNGSSDLLLRTGLQRLEPTDELRVSVGGALYYVGNLAIRHSRMAYRSLSATREEGNDLLVLFLSTLSLFCHEPLNSFAVVTGLPPGRMHQAEELMRTLKGQHQVIRHTASGPEEVNIRVERITVVPQPLGTYWSRVLDSRGKVVDEHSLQDRVGIIDVGFRTSDLVTVEDGEYISEKSRTVPTGLAAAYEEIASSILREHGVEREIHALDEAVIRGEINVSGQRVEISVLRDQAYERLATKIFVEVRSAWQLAEYDHVYITGGGGKALERFLKPQFTQAALIEEPVTANSRGYLGWAHRLWPTA